MRIYQDFTEMYSEVLRDVAELGVRIHSASVQNIQDPGEEYEMKEILGYTYELTNTTDYERAFTARELSWLNTEFQERIANFFINPGNAWQYRKEVWEPFLVNGKFDYTYNERMRLQYNNILYELRKRPNTRQAVMTIYSPMFFKDCYYFGGHRRIPCSLSYQFLRRHNYLNVIYNMRSCDVITHFRFDAALACMLLNHTAEQIDCAPGSLVHTIGSLHIFRKDSEGVF